MHLYGLGCRHNVLADIVVKKKCVEAEGWQEEDEEERFQAASERDGGFAWRSGASLLLRLHAKRGHGGGRAVSLLLPHHPAAAVGNTPR